MKVVFLDFDGTVNGLETREPPSPVHAGLFLNPVLVERVNRICEATGAVVVLSTTWRGRARYPKGHSMHLAFEEVVEALRLAGARFEVIGGTPDMRPAGSAPKSVYVPRAHEIARWVEMNKPDSFVIFDDFDDAAIEDRFVRCDRRTGLSEEGALEAIRILGGRA